MQDRTGDHAGKGLSPGGAGAGQWRQGAAGRRTRTQGLHRREALGGGAANQALDEHAHRATAELIRADPGPGELEGGAGGAAGVRADLGLMGGEASHDGSLFEMARDFGVLGSMEALEHLLAAYLRGAAPQPGDGATLALTASVCVEGIYAKLSLTGGVEHGEDGFTLSGSVTTLFGIGEESEGGGAELGVHEKKGLALVGSSPEICIEEIGLYMDLWLRAQQWRKDSFRDPHKWLQLAHVVFHPDAVGIATLVAGDAIADLIFGRGFQQVVLSRMKEGDHVESTHQVGIKGGFDLGSKEEGFAVEGSLGFGVEERSTSTKGADGQLETEVDDGAFVELSFGFTLLAVSVALEGSLFTPLGKPAEIDVKLKLEADTKGEGDLVARLIGAFAMARMMVAAKVAAGKMDGNDEVAPVVGELFGATAHTAIETCALTSGTFDTVGIQLAGDGKETVLSIYSGASHEAKTGVVNLSTSVELMHEVKRWPVRREGQALR